MKVFIFLFCFIFLSTEAQNNKCVSSGRKYSQFTIQLFFKKKLTQKIPNLTCNPYKDKDCKGFKFPWGDKDSKIQKGVCAIKYQTNEKQEYSLWNYSSKENAIKNGAIVTHDGLCGSCSTLQDLAVYMNHVDLTSPVRQCGFYGFVNREWSMNCLKKLGFSESCADIWYYNTVNTRKSCLWICLRHLRSPYNDPNNNCKLNDCLQCDEDISGPIFKEFSGRTRRNSGLFSAIYRPPSTIFDIKHDYH
eukprot:gene10020-2339_t